MPDWLKPVKEGADRIADKAVKMLKEGPVSVVEDIGQGLMDEIQTPERIASVAGGTVGTMGDAVFRAFADLMPIKRGVGMDTGAIAGKSETVFRDEAVA